MTIQYAQTTTLRDRIIEDLAASDVQITMSDQNMHLDDSEREVLVYGRRTQVLDTGFGKLSDVECWFKAWSGTVIVDEVYLPSDQSRAVLQALSEKIQGIKIQKSNELLSELAVLYRQWELNSRSEKDPLVDIFKKGSVLNIDNRYRRPPKRLRSPIFLKLDCDLAFRTGLQGLYGFYNDRADRVVITDRAEKDGGTFFIVAENKGLLSGYETGKLRIYMRSPRTVLPGFFPELEKQCFAAIQTGKVAGQIQSMLKSTLEAQMRKASTGKEY